jgi:hypothetical protein
MQKMVSSGILFVLAIITGIWLSNSGRPFSSLVLAIHKLIALASVVSAIILLRFLMQNVTVGLGLLFLLTTSALLILLLFITGALLSTGNPANDITLKIHQAAPFLAIITTTAAIFTLKQ